jgi:hypothetical protein
MDKGIVLATAVNSIGFTIVSILMINLMCAEPVCMPGAEPSVPHAYTRGVNDALNAVMLLNLEQDLQGTNRTWGEMSDIVRNRLGADSIMDDNIKISD